MGQSWEEGGLGSRGGGQWMEVWDSELGLCCVAGVNPTRFSNAWTLEEFNLVWGLLRLKKGEMMVRCLLILLLSPQSTLWPGCGQWGWQFWKVSFLCMLVSRQKSSCPLRRKVVAPDGNMMSRAIWSLSGMRGGLWEMGMQPFWTFSKFAQSHFSSSHTKKTSTRIGNLWEQNGISARDQDKSTYVENPLPSGGKARGGGWSQGQGVQGRAGLASQWSWLLISPALVCLLRPGELCAIFIWPRSRNEDQPGGKIP